MVAPIPVTQYTSLWEPSSFGEAAKAVGQTLKGGQCRRLRSLAGARQLPQLGGVVAETSTTWRIPVLAQIPATERIPWWLQFQPLSTPPCGSRRALARPRRRYVRHRGVASAAAFAASLGLDSSYSWAVSWLKPQPHGEPRGGSNPSHTANPVVAPIPATQHTSLWEPSSFSEAAKAVAQTKNGCQCRRLRSLAGARQLPQLGGVVAETSTTWRNPWRLKSEPQSESRGGSNSSHSAHLPVGAVEL